MSACSFDRLYAACAVTLCSVVYSLCVHDCESPCGMNSRSKVHSGRIPPCSLALFRGISKRDVTLCKRPWLGIPNGRSIHVKSLDPTLPSSSGSPQELSTVLVTDRRHNDLHYNPPRRSTDTRHVEMHCAPVPSQFDNCPNYSWDVPTIVVRSSGSAIRHVEILT